MVGSGKGAENGILIRQGAAIQRMRDVTTIVLDKTGTITEGKPGVTDVVALNGVAEDELVRTAAAAERGSEHPIGKAVVAYAEGRTPGSGPLAQVSEFEAVTGRGVRALVDEQTVLVGTRDFLREEGVELDEQTVSRIAELQSRARTAMLVAIAGVPAGVIGVADRTKTDSARAIRLLRELGVEPVMITGDNERTAKAVAHEVGIERVIAGVMPDGKSAEIKRLQQNGEVVAMVGDGINDAPALTQADVGLAIGTGTDVAIEAGDIVLVRGELSAVVGALRLSQATFRKIKQNLFWAFFYNVVMVPLAILGAMHPVLAEVAMAFSSINVVTNSRRLQKVRIND
jgi:Cu+-exporting ATPase